MTGVVSLQSGIDEGCKISLVIPNVHVSRIENWFIKWGMAFTADVLKNPPLSFHLRLVLATACVHL
jgi:hypothetical protein